MIFFNAETKPKCLCLPFIKQKKKLLQKKNVLWKRIGGLKKKKRRLLTALATVITKDPTTSLRKHANELKVQKKTERTAIRQDLSPVFNPLDQAIWGVLENKTNVTSHPNIGFA